MAGKEDALRDYVEVNTRIMKFYEKYPKGRILTEILDWKDGIVVMKATVYRDSSDIIAATGHAYEKEGSSFINKTSALENCETSACGRALAMLGFEIKKSIASKEEVANAMLNQNSEQSKSTGKLSAKQVGRLLAIGLKAGIKEPEIKKVIKSEYGKDKIEDLSKEQYDLICNRLEAKSK